MELYLNNYLKNNTEDELLAKYIDYFKIELDWFIYNYGDHVAYSYRRNKKFSTLYDIKLLLKCLLPSDLSSKNNVISNVIFSEDSPIYKYDIKFHSSIFQPCYRSIIADIDSLKLYYSKRKVLGSEYKKLCNIEYFKLWEKYKVCLIDKYRNLNIKALFLSSDQYFESKYLIDVFKEIHKPSFVFTHGLPAIYSLDVDNRSDYLMVWGEQIKNNYIKAGFNPNKIFVVGNSKYSVIKKFLNYRNNLTDVLIIPDSSIMPHQHTWDKPILIDRSLCILYLYKVKNVLSKFGVKKARYRLHPSISREWVSSFLNDDFFVLDTLPLENSLSKASLVIGATSTILIEALCYGVNYLIFQQVGDAISPNLPIVPPFDGSDYRISIATNETELEYMIKNNYLPDLSFLDSYIQPQDFSCLKNFLD